MQFHTLPNGLPLLTLLTACGGREPGVAYDGERLAAVDMHLHTGDWDHIPMSTQAFLAERFPFPLGVQAGASAELTLDPKAVVGQLDGGGVAKGVLFAVYAPRTVGVATNEMVIGDVETHPDRFYGLASLSVDDWANQGPAQLEALDAALDHPQMIGIKLAHAHMHFRMDDPDYYGIYELAARRSAPLYLHTGTSPFPGTSKDAPYTDPAFLEPAIVAHPDAQFILGHLGYDFVAKEHAGLETCIRLARDYDNVWLEPSAFGSEGSDPSGSALTHAMQRMREEGVVDKIIYGSDGPQSPGFVGEYAERTATAMEAAGYSAAEARAVFSGNFARAFAVEEVSL